MGIETLRRASLLFRKCHGTIPAVAHRLMVTVVTVGKLVILTVGWLVARNADLRTRFVHKLALHRQVLGWALGGG